MKTKLEQAKEMVSRTKTPDKEELEVILAYLKGEITVRQAASVMSIGSAGSLTHRVSSVLHWGLKEKHIKIELL